MSFNKKTVRDIDLTGKRVLMRADYNVPIKDGRITDDYRILQSLPTISYILRQKASLTIMAHLGRPKNAQDKDLSLAPVAKRLSELLDKPVLVAPDCIGEEVKQMASKLGGGQVMMLENLRFHPEEEKNSKDFAHKIIEATAAEVFVQDGFGVVHRAHASTEAIAKRLPAVAGFLLEKEVDTITRVMETPARPFVAVIGGAKIDDKIDILNRLIDMADCVAVAGAMANDFLVAEGLDVGKSLVDRAAIGLAGEILSKARRVEKDRNFNFLIPLDAVVSTHINGTTPTRIVDLASHSLADIEAYPRRPSHQAYSVLKNELILDIGPISAAHIAGAVKLAETVVWNGTCGVTETKGIAGAHRPFEHGTHMVMAAMIGASNRHRNKPFTLVGGGDTVGYVEGEGLIEDFSHVSTGGGASLELMSGHSLPGVEALLDKAKKAN